MLGTIGRVEIALCILTGAAQASNYCAPRERIAAGLTEKYGEQWRGGGLRDEGVLFEIWFSEKTGTWTILSRKTSGRTCVMASGSDWRQIEAEPVGEKS